MTSRSEYPIESLTVLEASLIAENERIREELEYLRKKEASGSSHGIVPMTEEITKISMVVHAETNFIRVARSSMTYDPAFSGYKLMVQSQNEGVPSYATYVSDDDLLRRNPWRGADITKELYRRLLLDLANAVNKR